MEPGSRFAQIRASSERLQAPKKFAACRSRCCSSRTPALPRCRSRSRSRSSREPECASPPRFSPSLLLSARRLGSIEKIFHDDERHRGRVSTARPRTICVRACRVPCVSPPRSVCVCVCVCLCVVSFCFAVIFSPYFSVCPNDRYRTTTPRHPHPPRSIPPKYDSKYYFVK